MGFSKSIVLSKLRVQISWTNAGNTVGTRRQQLARGDPASALGNSVVPDVLPRPIDLEKTVTGILTRKPRLSQTYNCVRNVWGKPQPRTPCGSDSSVLLSLSVPRDLDDGDARWG